MAGRDVTPFVLSRVAQLTGGKGPSINDVSKIFRVFGPISPSLSVTNSRNLPYYVCFWANPPYPLSVDVLYEWYPSPWTPTSPSSRTTRRWARTSCGRCAASRRLRWRLEGRYSVTAPNLVRRATATKAKGNVTVQRSPLLCAPGWVKFVPALPTLFCLVLPGSFF